MGHAGSWHEFPDRQGGRWWCPWLAPARKDLDHDHATAAARACRADFDGLIRPGVICNWNSEQSACLGEVVLAG